MTHPARLLRQLCGKVSTGLGFGRCLGKRGLSLCATSVAHGARSLRCLYVDGQPRSLDGHFGVGLAMAQRAKRIQRDSAMRAHPVERCFGILMLFRRHLVWQRRACTRMSTSQRASARCEVTDRPKATLRHGRKVDAVLLAALCGSDRKTFGSTGGITG
jgi:hypothetical protein